MNSDRGGPLARLTLSARIVAPIVGVGVLVAALAGPAGAHAATFVTVPPKSNPSGSGPFMVSFRPTSTSASTGIAYRLPGGEWQRCVGGSGGMTLSLGPYPDGDYRVQIADDLSFGYYASTGQLYSGFLQVCSTHEQPAGAISAYDFHVGSVPTSAPVAPAPEPAPAPQPAPPAPQPAAPGQFQPANVPWPLSLARASMAARAKAIRAWGARKPQVVSVHRVSYSKVHCRVTWRTGAGARRTRTVKVKRTSTYGVQAFAA